MLIHPLDDLSVDLLNSAHLFITWGIFWGAAIGAFCAWKNPPKSVHSAYAVLGYLIIIALIGPVATARFLNTFDIIPQLENEGLIVLVLGHIIALAWTWVLTTMTVRRYLRERKRLG